MHLLHADLCGNARCLLAGSLYTNTHALLLLVYELYLEAVYIKVWYSCVFSLCTSIVQDYSRDRIEKCMHNSEQQITSPSYSIFCFLGPTNTKDDIHNLT